MRPTIKDIANYCNVSEGTVDRALNNRYGIGEKTKARILEAARVLNYRPNQTGRALATGSTMTIGIVCFDLYNSFFSELIETLEKSAKEKGYFLDLILTHMDQKAERRGLEYLTARGVDGIILFPIGYGDAYSQYIRDLNIPVVTIYNWLSQDFDYVGVDNRSAFRDAVDFIASRNYQNIVFATPRIDEQVAIGNNVHALRMRLEGYLAGMEARGLTAHVVQGRSLAEETALRCARDHTAGRTAMLCSSDVYALNLLDVLQSNGVSIPRDIGLMGFDNLNVLRYVRPRLTTVQYSVQEMGQKLFDRLYARITGAQDRMESYLLDYSIVKGDSL